MNYINKKNGYISAAIIMTVGFGLCIPHAKAETEFMTSWQTKTYTPDWYTGKALPTYQSFINVGFELIENGKAADLSRTAVRWYVDDRLLKNEADGMGIKKFSVYNQKYGGDNTNIKISIPSYKGKSLEKTINIPIKDPEVVIDAPFFQKKVSKGDHAIFAWPFYFNSLTANTLSLRWRTEGKTQAGRIGESLSLSVANDIGKGIRHEIGATIGNTNKTSESATKNVIMETL